jgi:hypothetical protein
MINPPQGQCADLTKQVIALLLIAKQEENAAAKRRVELEQQLIELLRFSKPEGSKTESIDGYKVTFTSKINRTLDEAKWLEIMDQVPERLHPIEVKTTLKVVDKGMRWLEENNQDIYRLVAQAITSKPAKIAVKVEEV